MKSAEFGNYLKQIREQNNIPQRIVAYQLGIDTSTLSKMELGERPITISMIEGLAKVLRLDYKDLQIKYISNKILNEYNNESFIIEALHETLKHLK